MSTQSNFSTCCFKYIFCCFPSKTPPKSPEKKAESEQKQAMTNEVAMNLMKPMPLSAPVPSSIAISRAVYIHFSSPMEMPGSANLGNASSHPLCEDLTQPTLQTTQQLLYRRSTSAVETTEEIPSHPKMRRYHFQPNQTSPFRSEEGQKEEKAKEEEIEEAPIRIRTEEKAEQKATTVMSERDQRTQTQTLPASHSLPIIPESPQTGGRSINTPYKAETNETDKTNDNDIKIAKPFTVLDMMKTHRHRPQSDVSCDHK